MSGGITTLPLPTVAAEDGLHVVRAPGVGWYSGFPQPGELVGPGSALGLLRTLNRPTRLVLAAGPPCRVHRAPDRRVVAVGYGDPLLALERLDAAGLSSEGAAARIGGSEADRGLPDGVHAVDAPTDGVFYRRPSPDAAAFVEPGQKIRNGQPLGLVEVMKTFNQILYGGPGLPVEAEVVEIRCDDGDEVVAGQILMLVR